jgi:hemolysin activation/secretion protein
MEFQDALLATETNYARYGLSQSGNYRLDEHRIENLKGTLNLEYFHGGSVRWNSWYTILSLTAAHNLTADEQLLIGGESGLRGYPSDYQQGNRRALWTLERRYFPDWHPFKLFRLGGVLFTDVGRAWFDDSRNNGPDSGVLKDVGFGLRLASSRIEVQRMLHLDFAFPLDGDDSIDQVQVLLRGRTQF